MNRSNRTSRYPVRKRHRGATFCAVEAMEERRLLSFADVIPPAAEIGALPDITTSGGTQYAFSVNYSDNVAVLASTISTGDVIVTCGRFSAVPVLLNIDDASDGTPRVATYRFVPPGGSWDATDNGVYTISLQAYQVADVSGNVCPPGAIGSFTVNIGPPDGSPPGATATAEDVTSAGAAAYSFTVAYSDDIAVFTGSLDGSEIVVSCAATGYSATATLASLDDPLNGPQRNAVYTIIPPGGTWDSADNGSYTIALLGGHVRDVNGNYAAGAVIGGFTVNVPPPDQTPPTRSLKAAGVTRAGARAYTFSVTYRDPSLVSAASIGNRDVYVIGPRGYRAYGILVSKKPAVDSATIVATYRITPPGRSWDRSDNGIYTVMMSPRQVADILGNFVASGKAGAFKVNIGASTARFAAARMVAAACAGAQRAVPLFSTRKPIIAEIAADEAIAF